MGKKASRYRYQIYKDVLQHWYYSPFNRLLLKFDVDSFIKRQPNSHFLTKSEEKNLHIKRFLLCEHYNTLRWYTYMQHYRAMKTKIGQTKSFANRSYNQQFMGTFKKIRHLFAITPIGVATDKGHPSIIKYDQPLYNEYKNTSKNSLVKNLILHEELLTSIAQSPTVYPSQSEDQNQRLAAKQGNSEEEEEKEEEPSSLSSNPVKTNLQVEMSPLGQNLITQSTGIIRKYLVYATPIRQKYIQTLLNEKNYKALTEFVYKGQKIRGTQPTTNESSLVNQEKEYLLTNLERKKLQNSYVNSFRPILVSIDSKSSNSTEKGILQEILVNLLKKWKRTVNDQEFLNNYLKRRLDKREKLKEKKEKILKKKFKASVEAIILEYNRNNQKNISIPKGKTQNITLTTGVQKAIAEGIHDLTNIVQNSTKSDNFKTSKKVSVENQIRSSIKSLTTILKRLKKQVENGQNKHFKNTKENSSI